ncbi:MAG TPA: alpha/beta fold hydrolase [Trebonia sp.]|nr:alpha/beta fold hydrolase [Trebonia sp.]
MSLGDGLQVTVDERGPAAGRSTLLLHSGAGPATMAGLAAALADSAHVVTPTHPGFDGTPRPAWLGSVADLAEAYLDLLTELGLSDVQVIGNSVGGWVAAEMALRDVQRRVASLVLLDANGIRPDSTAQFTDIRGLPLEAIGRLSFHDPARRPDPAAMTEAQRATMLANQQALAAYAGPDFMFAPGLRRRLHRVAIPVLVAWGEADGVVTPEYGRAYAAAFPRARYTAIAEAGHFPQVERPAAVLAAIADFTRDAAGESTREQAGRAASDIA